MNILSFWRFSGVIFRRYKQILEAILNANSVLTALASAPFGLLYAQGSYEIQVYGSELVSPGATMFELHSNFTFEGSKTVVDGQYPTEHQLHETLEITHGFSDWFELGFYVFTSADSRVGWQWVGDHIRPRVAVPESWKWPVGVSLSTEIGYQRAVYSPDTWTIEIRPIVDKTIGRLYLCFNPTIDRSFHGPSVPQGVTFSPNVKVGYDVTKVVNAGFEYYGAVGPITGFDPLQQQQQQIFAVTDLNFSPKWEFNFGVGVGLTGGTDHLLVKMIIGRRVTTKYDSGVGQGGKGLVHGEREGDGQAGAAFATVRSLDSPAMNAHDSFDERQTQAVAGRVSPLHATLKDLREDLRFEARPVVFHDEQRGIFRAAERNCHGA